MDPEALAETCARLNRWEFMLVVAPLRVPTGTGSPVKSHRDLLTCVCRIQGPWIVARELEQRVRALLGARPKKK